MKEIIVSYKEVDYRVKYIVDKGINDASCKVWIGDSEPFDFTLTNYLLGTKTMTNSKYAIEDGLVHAVVKEICYLEKI